MTKKHEREILSTIGDTKKVEAKPKYFVIEVVQYAYLRQGRVRGWLGWSWVWQGTHGIGTQGEIRVGVYIV